MKKSDNMEMNELILDLFQVEELIPDLLDMECKFFTKTDSYRLIEQKCSNKCLRPNEQQQLYKDVRYAFTRLITTMKGACPNLTDEDILFCCLVKSGLDNWVICHCMGDVGKQPINQRKYRIKKKMNEAKCNFLFDMIFLNPSCSLSPKK
jgi:hypothetical protein